MVDLVELGIVCGEPSKRVPCPLVTAVVLDAFVGDEGEEEDNLALVHACQVGGQDTADGVGNTALNGVVVLAAVGERDIETVVQLVDMLVKEGDGVECAVEPILVGIEDEAVTFRIR